MVGRGSTYRPSVPGRACPGTEVIALGRGQGTLRVTRGNHPPSPLFHPTSLLLDAHFRSIRRFIFDRILIVFVAMVAKWCRWGRSEIKFVL